MHPDCTRRSGGGTRAEPLAEALLDALFRTAPVGIALLDRELRYLRVSDALARMNGLPVEAHLGKRLTDLMPGLREAADRIRLVFETGKPLRDQEVNVELPSAPGRKSHRLATYFPVRLGTRLAAVGAVVYDLTERKQANEALRRSEAGLARAQSIARLGSWELEFSDFRARWSDEMFRICGYAPGAFEPTFVKVLEMVHPDDRMRVKREAERAVRERRPYRVQYRVVRPDGSTRHVLTQADLTTDASGRATGMIATALDVTDHVEAEAERARNERFRETFLGILGHDLRNPLASALGSALLLRRDGSLGEQQLRQVDRILASAERMRLLIDQLLQFALARHAGGIPVAPRDADLGRICDEVADEIRMANAGQAVECGLEGDLRGAWDPDRLYQVVVNLADNAVQHGRRGAPVRIAARDRGHEVLLEVHNEGPPIPADVLPHIFDPFRGSAARPSRGAGLGLYIAREIVLAHRGAIDVESSGDRTTFRVRLPRRTVDPGLAGRLR